MSNLLPLMCMVLSTGSAGVSIQGTLLLPDRSTFGEVAIDASGKISCVGTSCSDTPDYSGMTHLFCPLSVISPGLINLHEHLPQNTLPPIAHEGVYWTHRNGWRKGTRGEFQLAGPPTTDDLATKAAGELRHVLGGETSVVSSGGVPGLLRNLSASPAMLEGLSGKTAYYDTFPMGDTQGEELDSGCAYPSIRPAQKAFAFGGAYFPHIAEGTSAAAHNEFVCADSSKDGALITQHTAVIHGVGMTPEDIAEMKKKGAKLVWSPRSNMSLYRSTAPVDRISASGITVALGSDWLASGSMNLLRELKCADDLNQFRFGEAFSDRDLWLMVTRNAAVASEFKNEIGELKQGLQGDVIVVDNLRGEDPYRAVIDAESDDIQLVLRGGKALYGDEGLVNSVGSNGCAQLDVCGAAKAVCVDTPGLSLDQIKAAAEKVYPLASCRGEAPVGEPACL